MPAKLRAPGLPVPPHRLRRPCRPCRPSARIARAPALAPNCSRAHIASRAAPCTVPRCARWPPSPALCASSPPGRPSARVARVAHMSVRLHRPCARVVRTICASVVPAPLPASPALPLAPPERPPCLPVAPCRAHRRSRRLCPPRSRRPRWLPNRPCVRIDRTKPSVLCSGASFMHETDVFVRLIGLLAAAQTPLHFYPASELGKCKVAASSGPV